MVKVLSLEKEAEIAQERPEYFRNGDNLSPAEKSVIEPEDTWVISFINCLPEDEQNKIGESFKYTNLGHYLSKQSCWFEKEISLLTHRLGREPTQIELIDDAKDNHNMTRYKLCYVLHFPKRIIFNMNKYPQNRSLVDLFLADAEMLHKFGYPYFTEINTNTFVNKGYDYQ